MTEDSWTRIPGRGDYTEKARLERVVFLRERTGAALAHGAPTHVNATMLRHNVESFIGVVEVPVGVAGPLSITAAGATRTVFAPIATTEGALVASINRGVRAMGLSGGVCCQVLGQRMTRAPLFVFASLDDAWRFSGWVKEHTLQIAQKCAAHSRHARLVELRPRVHGNRVVVTFEFETGDAAGQNMTTVCTWEALRWIESELREAPSIRFVRAYLEGNSSGDKKMSQTPFAHRRGLSVTAECLVRADVVRAVLKTTTRDFVEAYQGALSTTLGAGLTGFNLNVANVIAGIFTATGQDVACVHESSVGVWTLEDHHGDLYAALSLPSLVMGTVGGGTHLPTQQAYLELLGGRGAPGLAEAVVGFALALELSTGAAMTAGHFAHAHQKLGRRHGLSFRSFRSSELTADFFEGDLQRALGEPDLRVERVQPAPHYKVGSSIISAVAADGLDRLVGILPYDIEYTAQGQAGRLPSILKIKPSSREVAALGQRLASTADPELGAAWHQHAAGLGFEHTAHKELALYRQNDPRFLAHTPRVYAARVDEDRELYLLALERLEGVDLLDSVDRGEPWSEDHLLEAVRGLAELQSIWLGRTDELLREPWLGPHPTSARVLEMAPLWLQLARHAHQEFPEVFWEGDLARAQDYIETIARWRPALEACPQTLVHNDFGPRNIAFRKNGSLRLCVYDWELATVAAPQRDLVELLSFALTEVNEANVAGLVEEHRRRLIEYAHVDLSAGAWAAGFALSVREFFLQKLPLFFMTHTFRDYPFIGPLTRNVRALLELSARQ